MSPQNPNQSPNQGNDQPTLKLANTEDYRDGYANSVQVRMSVWDFFLVFGTMSQQSAEELTVKNFQGIDPARNRPRRSGTCSATTWPNTSRLLAPSHSSSFPNPADLSTKAWPF